MLLQIIKVFSSPDFRPDIPDRIFRTGYFGPDFRTRFSDQVSDHISDRIFRPDFGTDIEMDFRTDIGTDFWRDFQTDFRTDFQMDFQTDFRTDFQTDFQTNFPTDFLQDFQTDHPVVWHNALPLLISYFIKLFAGDLQCEFIRTFFIHSDLLFIHWFVLQKK